MVAGIGAKSVFQIGGAGSVGTGSLRGMPFLGRLRRAGCGIWPFDPPAAATVVEVYPRLCTGPVRKRVAVERLERAASSGFAVGREHLSRIEASEDAFDAAMTALVMSRDAMSLRSLQPTTDPVERLEGAIWWPPGGTTGRRAAPGPLSGRAS